MLDAIDLGCPILRAPFFEQAITLSSYFGHWLCGGVIGVVLIALGYLQDNDRSKQAGIAIVAALLLAGGVAELLKHAVQLPRPLPRSSYGFPSGHTSAAFSLATTLTATVPALGPIFFMLAVMTAISRLYLRAHYTSAVVGGIIIGVLTAAPIAVKMIQPAGGFKRSFTAALGWLAMILTLLGVLAFFYSAEKNILAHLVQTEASPTNSDSLSFDFGTAEARSALRYGWSGDETWENPKRTVVWATGVASEIVMNIPTARDYRLRLSVFPYAPKGPTCQRVEVKINETSVSKILLQQGWHKYEFSVPKEALRTGANVIQFFYDYAEAPRQRGRNPDNRPLSVAFDKLEWFARN